MSWPVTSVSLTQSESVNAIAEAEAGLAQCLTDLFCNTLAGTIAGITDPDKQASITKTIFCAYSCKEKAMGELINALANKILADKGLVPGGDGADGCNCDC